MRKWQDLPRQWMATSDDVMTISVRKSGLITWNGALGRAMRHPKYVRLLYCDGVLGLKRAEATDKGAFPVTPGGFYARSALKAINPNGELPSQSIRREATREEDVYTIDISDLF